MKSAKIPIYDRRKNLILSVYKILLEAETDREVCKENWRYIASCLNSKTFRQKASSNGKRRMKPLRFFMPFFEIPVESFYFIG